MGNKITDLKFDDKNFNKGTQYGKSLMEKSLSKFGAGRSILIDKNNKIIAGNKTTENFGELGLENVQIVDTDGKTLIAVRRNDIDLDTPEGREFALADNQTAKANIDFDFEMLESELEIDTLEEWGLDKPDFELLKKIDLTDENFEKELDKYDDNNCEAPITPNFHEKYSYFIILVDNEIDENNLRANLGLTEKHTSHKSTDDRLSNVISFEKIQKLWEK